jgi:urease accessory protein
MDIRPDQLLMLLQYMDSAFPTGAFAHSGGLETYTQAEIVRTPDDLLQLISAKLEMAAHTDFIIIHCAMTAYAANDRAVLNELDDLCSASKIASETRHASEKIGRRMLENVLNVHPDEHLSTYRAKIAGQSGRGHHAVVHGLVCAAMGLEPRAALLAFAYALVANQTSAALKLISMGQTQAQAVLGASHSAMQSAVEAALNRSLDDFGSFAPALDIRTMQHEHLFRRLSIS